MQIPFVDLTRYGEGFNEGILAAVTEVIDSGHYILGEKVKKFETELSSYLGVKYCVGVASGTDAITLSLIAQDIGFGDEVITTNITAYPTITGIKRSGAKVVTVDILEKSGLINPSLISNKINSRTKAIVPVHLYGQCCDMDDLKRIAKENNIVIVEDCAQAIGATYKGDKAGAFGMTSCFSFYPTKNLGCIGDGGAIATNSEKIYKKLLFMRNYGQTDRYHHDYLGFNSRLDEIQASILLAKIGKLDSMNKQRQHIAQVYKENLNKVDIVKSCNYGEPVYHLFVIKHSNRDKLQKKLLSESISTLIHYPIPVHMQKDFKHKLDYEASLSNSVNFSKEILSLPLFPGMTDEEMDYVIDKVNKYS